MLRIFHRWPGLLAAALLIVLSLSGAVLSVYPAAERLSTPSQTQADLTVGVLAARIKAAIAGVEEIKRAPSGQITAYWYENGAPGSAVIDPATGRGVAKVEKSGLERWLVNLHRSLFLGDGGRVTMAASALAMLLISVSGLLLVLRRTGGWRRFFAPLKGSSTGRIHVEIARFSFPGLMLSSVTALWMAAATFGIVPQGPDSPGLPAAASGRAGIALTDIPALATMKVSAFRSLTFPAAGDNNDVYTLTGEDGSGYLDQGTGALLSWTTASPWDRISATMAMLHTGRGAPLLGLALGLMALGIPAMTVTGAAQWWRARRARPRISGNVAPNRAGTIILVGSEGGSTWGFAGTLHAALAAAGERVHVAPMSAFDPSAYRNARQIIVMTATYGDGDAPASARGFAERLAAWDGPAAAPVAILGFGDRSFPSFCGYAKALEGMFEAKGWAQRLPPGTVDRQSPQDFARWGRRLGDALGIGLELQHEPARPRSCDLTLISRRDFGASVQTPSAILRFGLPHASFWQKLLGGSAGFSAGDLLAILPEGSEVPRFYSLASARRDGFVEICVRKHPGGLCSNQLLDLKPGDHVRAFFRRNPAFRPEGGGKPVILIGAGTGIAPLAGFIRANTRHRPMHLFFGARHPASDFFYAPELARWQADGQLSTLTTAFSRTAERAYVQDALRRDGNRIAALIASGAQILVCGGTDMAAGVSSTLTEILAPLKLTTTALKMQGRYVEDIY